MSNLDVLFRNLNKKYGDGTAVLGPVERQYSRIPFSSPRANYMLYGGIPTGRLIELSGPESSGKTTTMLDLIANYQRMPEAREVVIFDNEQTFDYEYAARLGVNVKKIRVISPDAISAEAAFDILLDLLKTGEVGLLGIDSIATLVPQQIVDESSEKYQMGGIAKSLTTFVNKAIPYMKKFDTTIIAINQVRDDMANMYNQFTTPGGRAFKHACSVRILCSMGRFIDENGNPATRSLANPIGHFVQLRVLKSKISRPDRKLGYYTLNYITGIDYLGDTIDTAIEFGFIRQRGAWFDIVDPKTGEAVITKDGEVLKFQGRKRLQEYYEQNKKEFQKLHKKVNEEIVKTEKAEDLLTPEEFDDDNEEETAIEAGEQANE